MAKPPKCKICNHEHWGADHVFDGAARPLPVVEAEAPFTPAELSRLTELEALIEPRIRDWEIVGNALAEIRDKRLYRASFENFESYCNARWQINRGQANRLIAGAAVVGMVANGSQGSKNLPKPLTERVARELKPLAGDPDEMKEAWAAVVEEHGPDPTAAQVAAHVEKRMDAMENEPDLPPIPDTPEMHEVFAEGVALLTAVEAAAAEPRRMPPEAPETRVASLKRRSRYCTTHTLPCDCISARVVEALLFTRASLPASAIGALGPLTHEALNAKVEEALRAMSVPAEEWNA